MANSGVASWVIGLLARSSAVSPPIPEIRLRIGSSQRPPVGKVHPICMAPIVCETNIIITGVHGCVGCLVVRVLCKNMRDMLFCVLAFVALSALLRLLPCHSPSSSSTTVFIFLPLVQWYLCFDDCLLFWRPFVAEIRSYLGLARASTTYAQWLVLPACVMLQQRHFTATWYHTSPQLCS